MKTIGVSPKVKNPALLGLLVGVALIAYGALSGDTGVRDTGVTVLVAAVGYGGVGAASNPGVVVRESKPTPSDQANASAFSKHLPKA